MTELNITSLIDIDPSDYSASIAETGMQNIGQITWQRAKDDAPQVITDDNREDFNSWVGSFGAWEGEEIEGWSLSECNALLLQFVSGDLREAEDLAPGDGLGGIDWVEYEELSQAGQVSSRLFVSGDKLYFQID